MKSKQEGDFWQVTSAGKPKNACKPRWSISKGWSWYQAKNLNVEWGLVCCGLVDWTRIILSLESRNVYIYIYTIIYIYIHNKKIPPKKKTQGSISWFLAVFKWPGCCYRSIDKNKVQVEAWTTSWNMARVDLILSRFINYDVHLFFLQELSCFMMLLQHIFTSLRSPPLATCASDTESVSLAAQFALNKPLFLQVDS